VDLIILIYLTKISKHVSHETSNCTLIVSIIKHKMCWWDG